MKYKKVKSLVQEHKANSGSQDSDPNDLGPTSIYLTTRKTFVFPHHRMHPSVIMLN